MASSDLLEPFTQCPSPFQHLLLRGVLTAATLYERAGTFQKLLTPNDAVYSIVLWSYVINATKALETLGRVVQRDNTLTAAPLLRTELECLIAARWVMTAPPDERNRRIARVIRKTVNELERSTQLGSLHGHVTLSAAHAYLDTDELSAFKPEKPAPNVRQMADEGGCPHRYEEYRRWSSEMHAGFGMFIREGPVDARLARLEHLLLGAEYACELIELLRPTIPEHEHGLFDSILGTFRSEYLARFQDAYFSAWVTTTMRERDRAEKADCLKDVCGRLWQFPRPEQNPNMPFVAVTDVVRGIWGKKFQCVSVRFRNISSEPMNLRARLSEHTRRRWRLWRNWRLSCEDAYFHPPLLLLPEQSGYLMFPGPTSEAPFIELDSGEPIGRVDLCRRPDAAMQNVPGHSFEIVTVRTEYASASRPRSRVLQPIVVL